MMRTGELLAAAREGARHAFLTKPGGTAYGAAVLTSSGRIHRSGQYSSFNHCTNVHAEMAALVVAASAGDADVVTLALVCTACVAEPARPCGVCRQVIREHAQRTGRQIEVIMASWDGAVIERMSSDELLPVSWEPNGQGRTTWLPADPPGSDPLVFGDQVEIEPGTLGLVWHPAWIGGRAWIKAKYRGSSKLPHSYTDWQGYQAALAGCGLGEPSVWGDRILLADPVLLPRIPCRPVQTVGLQRIRELLAILREAGIAAHEVEVSGSWASGLARPDSDADLVVRVEAERIAAARFLIAAGMLAGRHLVAPQASATWARLAARFGDPFVLVRAGRFADTFQLIPSGLRCSLIWVEPGQSQPLPEDVLTTAAPVCHAGVVANVAAWAKPVRWTLAGDDGVRVEVETWHKDGMLVQPGDRVRIAGLACGSNRCLQLSADRDHIRWEGPLS